MQKNWYLVYTKPKSEKKVAALLTKRKINNFCPQNRKQVKHLRRNKLVNEPLFSSYVFVQLEAINLVFLKDIENILNVVYWKGNPAIINNEEIDIIKDFINDYDNIRMEKTIVNLKDSAKIVDRPAYTMDGNLIRLKNTSVRINLPSIGYTLVADLAGKEELISVQSPFIKEIILQ